MSDRRLIENYRDNPSYRKKFFEFVATVFPGLDFETWYKYGCWSDGYIPFSFVQEDTVISNVSVSLMDLWVDGQLRKGIQFGTVGTIPGFRKYSEVTFEVERKVAAGQKNLRRLDFGTTSDRELILRLLKDRLPLTRRFGASGYESITLWHIMNIFPENIYYLSEADMLLILTPEGPVLNVWDVVFTEHPDWESLLPLVSLTNTQTTIRYHFPPDQVPFHYDRTIPEESLLFVKDVFSFQGQQFRFPVTAQT